MILSLLALLLIAFVQADVIDESASLQNVFDEALLDIHGERWSPGIGESLKGARDRFAGMLTDSEARELWNAPLPLFDSDPLAATEALGNMQARLQHVSALEMISSQRAGNLDSAREWRSIIKLPKFANSVEGALALQRLGASPTQRDEVSRLLAKEFVIWQITRAREKADALMRLIQEGRATPTLLYARASEIQALSNIPVTLLKLAIGSTPSGNGQSRSELEALLSAARENSNAVLKLAAAWRMSLEERYPNLLSEEDVERRERIVLKLLRLIPKEYQSGVRDGEITIPIEYREAKNFTIQTRQIINELSPVWRQSKAQALEEHGPNLLVTLEELEQVIDQKKAQSAVDDLVAKATNLLQRDFGLSLKRAGMAGDVVGETALEVRSLLGQSLAAAQNNEWRKAEQLRLDAYINFDLEIEARTSSRSDAGDACGEDIPGWRSWGAGNKSGFRRETPGEELTAAYQRAFEALEECSALIKVGLSPMAATISSVFIVAREGLEAVVILAALLAGLRGAENAGIRRRISAGAWLALAVTAVVFAASRTLLQGLSHYGETLEAVISIVAVAVLLIVTNWVFHKYYWTGWNARLRELSKAAQRQQETRWESMALVGVGFMTIFREGFETTLFMQSLILEAGMRPVLLGLGLGGVFIAAVGFAVFSIGAKLPYRKMLVVTGVLVIFVLFTFLGSTVRLFQTVGWLPVHPVPGLELPSWMGVWLGLYPTWEGLLIPFGTFAYVGAMWLFVKFSAKRVQQREAKIQRSAPLAA